MPTLDRAAPSLLTFGRKLGSHLRRALRRRRSPGRHASPPRAVRPPPTGSIRVDLELNELVGGRDFPLTVVPSPLGDPNGEFGYSVSCPRAVGGRSDAAGMAVGSYRAEGDQGVVFVAPESALTGPGLTADDLVAIRPASAAAAGGMTWFGHEVALADADGDGLPDLAVGARFEGKQRGAAYFLPGRVLKELFDSGAKTHRIDEIPAVRFVSGSKAPREFGFGVAILAATPAQPGRLVFHQDTSVDGTAHVGAVALVSVPQTADRVTVESDAFVPSDAMEGDDFGGTLQVVGAEERTLLVGGHSDPEWFGLPRRSGAAWEIEGIDSSSPMARRIFDLADVFGDRDAPPRHLVPGLLSTGSGELLLVGATKPWQGASSETQGVFVSKGEGETPLLLSAPSLSEGSWPYSLNASHDLDGDAVPDLVTAAPSLAASAGLARGALVVINGQDVIDAAAAAMAAPARGAVLRVPGEEMTGVGSKRRLPVTRDLTTGDTLLCFGIPYGPNLVFEPPRGPGAIAVARISPSTSIWRGGG